MRVPAFPMTRFALILTLVTLAVLVMGYPCALGMATPLAMIRGGGEAARQGILGKAITPFLLDRVNQLTGGLSLAANRGRVHPADARAGAARFRRRRGRC